MKNLSEILVVEFSLKQQAFHKETVKEMLENNIGNALLKRHNDYLPIGFFDTHDEADKFIDTFYETIKKSETDLQQDSAIDYFKNVK